MKKFFELKAEGRQTWYTNDCFYVLITTTTKFSTTKVSPATYRYIFYYKIRSWSSELCFSGFWMLYSPWTDTPSSSVLGIITWPIPTVNTTNLNCTSTAEYVPQNNERPQAQTQL
jgi:hypothetical protein